MSIRAARRVLDVIAVGGGPDAIAARDDAVWVANTLDGTVARIDPASDAVTATVPVGGEPAGLSLDQRTLRVADRHRGVVTEINARRATITRTFTAGNSATGVAGAWVGVRAGGRAHRGGTLRLLLTASDFDSLDPAIQFTIQPAQLLGMTHDGLTSFEHVAGAEGDRLVPDLALALPAPSRDGRTYSFRLRRGIRYSNGVVLRASDFRHALERLFSAGSAGAGFYSHLAPDCRINHPCDLSQTIETDDRAGTVTLHLDAPDPELLYKLALPFASAVPPSAPEHDSDRTPSPAPVRTGSPPTFKTSSCSPATRTFTSGRAPPSPTATRTGSSGAPESRPRPASTRSSGAAPTGSTAGESRSRAAACSPSSIPASSTSTRSPAPTTTSSTCAFRRSTTCGCAGR